MATYLFRTSTISEHVWSVLLLRQFSLHLMHKLCAGWPDDENIASGAWWMAVCLPETNRTIPSCRCWTCCFYGTEISIRRQSYQPFLQQICYIDFCVQWWCYDNGTLLCKRPGLWHTWEVLDNRCDMTHLALAVMIMLTAMISDLQMRLSRLMKAADNRWLMHRSVISIEYSIFVTCVRSLE